jgi:hypothetical protein
LSPVEILPNLGAEEGDDWRAYLQEPHARVAARLWSHLFSRRSQIWYPSASRGDAWHSKASEEDWPACLGTPPEQPVFDWLEKSDYPIAWLNTPAIETGARDAFGRAPFGPTPDCVHGLHDKAFAVESARDLNLHDDDLGRLIRIIDEDELKAPDELIEQLDADPSRWPEWTDKRFTLKPRFGSSGRGRVAGQGSANSQAIRGACDRLRARGGAIFEPWLHRETDLSVAMYIPEGRSHDDMPTVLGSLEMLATQSGGFRGHCGEVDSRGRVFSGHRLDERLRGDAAGVAERARRAGFFGPCGIDAFTYFESERVRLRGLVEFNARPTMGLVTIGLVRRALPRVRELLELRPGDRRAFVMTILPPGRSDALDELRTAGGPDSIAFDLSVNGEDDAPRPFLLFAQEREKLRAAHLAILGC